MGFVGYEHYPPVPQDLKEILIRLGRIPRQQESITKPPSKLRLIWVNPRLV